MHGVLIVGAWLRRTPPASLMCIQALAQFKLRMLNVEAMLAKVVCVWAQAMTYRL